MTPLLYNNETVFLWTIEFVPENKALPSVEFEMSGTHAEAEQMAEKKRPGYDLSRIVFHRRGAIKQ